MQIKMSKIIKEIKVSEGKVEKDYFDNPQLMVKLDVKLNKKKMLFLKIKAIFCNLFRIPVEIINDSQNINIKIV